MSGDKPQSVTKLLIDRENDFRFHCAYLAYSKSWDENDTAEAREKLNELIESLSNDKISYPLFYDGLNEFRRDFDYQKNRIQTVRKREWRRKEAKRIRVFRHKKR